MAKTDYMFEILYDFIIFIMLIKTLRGFQFSSKFHLRPEPAHVENTAHYALRDHFFLQTLASGYNPTDKNKHRCGGIFLKLLFHC